MSGEVEHADMHFKAGMMGWRARFFAKRRAARDLFDQTVVLPCIIFIVLARLNDLGRLDAWAVVVGLVIPASAAGLWIGACFGPSGQLRAMLRSVLVGVFEGAASVAIAKETITQHDALVNAFNLIYVNYVFYWFCALISSLASDFATISEQQWQRGVPWRAYSMRILRAIWQKLILNTVQRTPATIKETSFEAPTKLQSGTIQIAPAQYK
jgi:hypothetical protein